MISHKPFDIFWKSKKRQALVFLPGITAIYSRTPPTTPGTVVLENFHVSAFNTTTPTPERHQTAQQLWPLVYKQYLGRSRSGRPEWLGIVPTGRPG